jgi:3-isopropylmalate/(R)-2-methylmalate dehydratase large subunit
MSTMLEKIWQAHLVDQLEGNVSLLYVDRHLLHEVTSPQAFEGLTQAARELRRPDLTFGVADHVTPTDLDRKRPLADPVAEAQLAALEKNTSKFKVFCMGMDHPNQGVIHVVMPELGVILPGQTVFCGDSHTTTHGAFGALAFGVGTSEVEHIMATQCLPQSKPKSLVVKVAGQLQKPVSAKDLILAIIANLGFSGGTGHMIEYQGPAISALDMEERMTVCNMSVECGAKAGFIAPDEVTFAYLKDRMFAPKGRDFDKAVEYWRTLPSDPDAVFDRELSLNASDLGPRATWGTNPAQSVEIDGQVPDPKTMSTPEERQAAEKALAYMDLKPGTMMTEIPIDTVFIGSCTNGRLTDLIQAAELLKGRKIAPKVRALAVPGSGKVKHQAEDMGLDQIFIEAGFEWRAPGCSMCLAMNPDKVEPGQRAAATSNRNFQDRQGQGSRTHLVSPATAAVSALTGRLTDVRKWVCAA